MTKAAAFRLEEGRGFRGAGQPAAEVYLEEIQPQ